MNVANRPFIVLASSTVPLLLQGAPAGLALRREPAALARWGQGVSVSDKPLSLLLDQVRGTYDAAILHVGMQLPDANAPQSGATRYERLGTAALYGLRLASQGACSRGLTLILDISALAARLRPLLLTPAATPLALTIDSHPGLPPGKPITIGQVCIGYPD